MKTVDQILDLYKERSKYYQPLQSKQRVIQSIYNGTMEVPLPDLEDAAMPFALTCWRRALTKCLVESPQLTPTLVSRRLSLASGRMTVVRKTRNAHYLAGGSKTVCR